ncbi:cytochrome c [Allostella vacuolata]|nr:cytochrome c [Stella vacuolata]
MRKFLLATVLAAGLAGPAFAAGDAPKPPAQDWSFGGLFGTFDRASAQRGFQVYKEVCSACHGAYHLAYRNLAAIGFNEDEVKGIAAGVTVRDGPNDEGEMFERPGRPSDKFARPFANEKAARAANNGAYPPDLSLMTKARPDGANYVHGLLTGYAPPPAGVTMGEGMNYNKYFPGHQIAMAPPLNENGVTYSDGTPASVDQMARDVTTFLAWAAEPEMEERKKTGIKVILFLLVLTGLLYATKRKIWAAIH